jgi:hypothetical protein
MIRNQLHLALLQRAKSTEEIARDYKEQHSQHKESQAGIKPVIDGLEPALSQGIVLLGLHVLLAQQLPTMAVIIWRRQQLRLAIKEEGSKILIRAHYQGMLVTIGVVALRTLIIHSAMSAEEQALDAAVILLSQAEGLEESLPSQN